MSLYQIQEQVTQVHAVRRRNNGYIQGVLVMGRGRRGLLGTGYAGILLRKSFWRLCYASTRLLRKGVVEGGRSSLLGYSCQKCVT